MNEPRQLSREELSEVVDVVLHVGQTMLQAGAASFRTEETMAEIGLGLGADRLDLYVTPTGIVATAVSGNEQRTRVGRVETLGVNMAQVVAFNKLSRHVSLIGATLPALRAEIAAIREKPRELPNVVTILAVGIACAAFAQILGGGERESVSALAGAGVAQWVRMVFNRARVNVFAMTVICAWIGSLLGWGVCSSVQCERPDLAVIASVLLLVPGVPLVTSVIDLTNYDLISGVTRGTLAALIALSIGVGVLLTLWITGLRIVP